MWLVFDWQYIYSLFNILTVHIYQFGGYDDGNLPITRYYFPRSRIEVANALARDRFPESFNFGVATAAYQIEETWNASGGGQSIWDYMTHVNPIINRSNADIATDTYRRYKEDIQLARNLGCNIYRISLSWSKILPDGHSERVNKDGIRYYNDLINEILVNGMQPMVTIFHWDLPHNLQRLGGWMNPLTSTFFADYARIVFTAFGDRVKYWITINEPINICTFGYGAYYASALNQSGIADYLCGHNLLLAHAQIYNIYNYEFRYYQEGKVGITLPLTWFEPGPSMEDVAATERAYQWFNEWFLHPLLSETGDYPEMMKNQIKSLSILQGFTNSRLPKFTNLEILYIKGTIDFLGINYYTTRMIRAITPDIHNISLWNDAKIATVSNNSWLGDLWVKNTPWGLGKLLDRLNNDYLLPEIIITENGYADMGGIADMNRTIYHHQHIREVLSAMQRGIDIAGYIVWSLIDNFESRSGYFSRFGLYYVDFEDKDRDRPRQPKTSSKIISDIYKTRIIRNITDILSDSAQEESVARSFSNAAIFKSTMQLTLYIYPFLVFYSYYFI